MPIELPPPVLEALEPPDELVGFESPVVISMRDGHLFRGDNEFYPISGNRYYTLESSSIITFRRSGSGEVDAILWTRGDGKQSVLSRLPEG